MNLLPSLTLLLSIATAVPTTRSTSYYNNLTIAIVRTEPANWPMPLMNKNQTDVKFDINAAVARVKLIDEVASNGANLVVFPELWFPEYVTSTISISPFC